MIRSLLRAALAGVFAAAPIAAQVQQTAEGVTLDFVDADVRAIVQLLAPYLDRPVVFGNVGGARLTLQSPRPEPRSNLLSLLRSALSTQNLEIVEDGASYVVRSRASAPPLQPQIGGAAPRGSGGVALHVIRLRHARATNVAATVNALYGRASALGELGGGRPSTLAGELRDNRNAAYAEPNNGVASPGAQRSGRLEGEVSIVPDASTNQLLIRASRADFELIQAAVSQLDLRPIQVMIQVTIAEVRRNSDFSYALSAAVGEQHIRGSDNTTVQGRTLGNAANDLLIAARGIGGVDLSLILSAGESRGAVSILSRPLVFAANNERAEILVGDQRPFVQLQRTTDGGSVDQVVQYKDVGTRLSVLPSISGDGYVQLQVTQEVNNASNVTGPQGAPVISTRTVETALLVRDGQTAVLGGLAEAIRERGSSGVPLLSSLPLIGGIFGSKNRLSNDTELFVFLTPRVVRDDAELDSTVNDVRQNGGRAGNLGRKPPIILPRPKRPQGADPRRSNTEFREGRQD